LLKEQRKLGGIVVTAMGMRGEESSARARRPAVTIGKRLTSKRLREMAAEAALREVREGERLVIEWLPIHNWTEDDVWHELGYSLIDVNRRRRLARSGHQDEALAGWTAHPAYVLGLGNQRLSCSLCILGCKSDLENGARHNPALFREYLKIELDTGFTFKANQALADLDVAQEIAPDLLGDRSQQAPLFS
jgi:3'-phosphoadenosine 5'-phosphosulfate sulfotransferase (PAPS reductase)/FAD synthetase